MLQASLHGPIFDPPLQVLDFGHLVKLMDTMFVPPCMMTMQPVGEVDYKGVQWMTLPRLHKCIASRCQPALQDFFDKQLSGTFQIEFEELLSDKNEMLMNSKTPHLQVRAPDYATF